MADRNFDVCEVYREVVENISYRLMQKRMGLRCIIRRAIDLGMPGEQVAELSNLSPDGAKRRLIHFLKKRGVACYANDPDTIQKISLILASYTGDVVPMKVRRSLAAMMGMGFGEEAIHRVISDTLKGNARYAENQKIITTKKAMATWVKRTLGLYRQFFQKVIEPNMSDAQKMQLQRSMEAIMMSETGDLDELPEVQLMLQRMGIEGAGKLSGVGFRIGATPSKSRKAFMDLIGQLSTMNRGMMDALNAVNIDGESIADAKVFYKTAIRQLAELRTSIRGRFQRKCLPMMRQTHTGTTRRRYADFTESMNEGPDTLCTTLTKDAEVLDAMVDRLSEDLASLARRDSSFNEINRGMKALMPELRMLALEAVEGR